MISMKDRLKKKLKAKKAIVTYAARNGNCTYTAKVELIPTIGYSVTCKETRPGYAKRIHAEQYCSHKAEALYTAKSFIRLKCPRWRGYIKGPEL